MVYRIGKGSEVIASYDVVGVESGVLIARDMDQGRPDYFLAPGQWEWVFWEKQE